MNNIERANLLIGEIIDKVGKQEYSSKGYSNPLSGLKRDFIENATTIEEIYVERALAGEPDPEGADTLKRVKQDVKTKYRKQNYAKCYTITISDEDVKEGFTSKGGIQKLANKKIEALNRGVSVDEFYKMQELINTIPTMENLKIEIIQDPSTNEGVLNLIKKVEEHSDDMVFSSKDYCSNFECDIPKERQLIITTPKVYANCKVELAKIYNCSLIELKQRVVLIKAFDDETVKMLLVDRELLRVHPTLYNLETQRNAKGMFTNYHLNVAYIMATSEMYGGVIYKTA
ncbi:MAG: hypothetical protein ACI3T9_06730 [Romboutsia timonensis]